jgi:hypothetical protein
VSSKTCLFKHTVLAIREDEAPPSSTELGCKALFVCERARACVRVCGFGRISGVWASALKPQSIKGVGRFDSFAREKLSKLVRLQMLSCYLAHGGAVGSMRRTGRHVF